MGMQPHSSTTATTGSYHLLTNTDGSTEKIAAGEIVVFLSLANSQPILEDKLINSM